MHLKNNSFLSQKVEKEESCTGTAEQKKADREDKPPLIAVQLIKFPEL